MRKENDCGLVLNYTKFLFFLIAALLSAKVFAQSPLPRPIKITCGSSDEKGPFVAIDYELRKSSGKGARSEKYPQTFTTRKYPFSDYRIINLPTQQFRVAAQILEETHVRGRYFLAFSIYEEAEAKLLRRAAANVDLQSLEEASNLIYEVPNSKKRISCHAYFVKMAATKSPRLKITTNQFL